MSPRTSLRNSLFRTLMPWFGAWTYLAILWVAEAQSGQARAEYSNLTTQKADLQAKNPAVQFFGGYLRAAGDGQTGNSYILQQCSFGQPFSQWFPSQTYSQEILGNAGKDGVMGALYVSPETRSFNSVRDSKKPFRYKLMMYQETGADVTAFKANDIEQRFTENDRKEIDQQIQILRLALAASPLDMNLQSALLDVIHDLAVAELQAVQPLLAELAKLNLGLGSLKPAEFIIDREIEAHTKIIANITNALKHYQALLTVPFPNIDPSSIDTNLPPGSWTMGEYIFRKAQPRRNSLASQYVTSTGPRSVPRLEDGRIVTDPDLFQGYKDLNVLLLILAQHQQQAANLARLLGLRQGPDDVARARRLLEETAQISQKSTDTLKNWFSNVFVDDPTKLTEQEAAIHRSILERSGLLAAIHANESGKLEITGVLPFLNGSANVLGYDPNLLLVVQDTSGSNPPRESFDTLRELLKGDNRPLTVALNTLKGTPGVSPPDGAQALYDRFIEKAEMVAADIQAVRDAHELRYRQVTGYNVDDAGFNHIDPKSKPKPGSELHALDLTISNLEQRQLLNGSVRTNIEELLVNTGSRVGDAYLAVTNANEKYNALLSAQAVYTNTTISYYEQIIDAATRAATLQSTFDTVNAVATLATAAASTDNAFGAGVGYTSAAVVGAVGLANIGVQSGAANITASRERDLDYAAMEFTVKTQLPDATLAVNQAKQQLQALLREQIANQIATVADQGALDQARNEREALIAELTRIKMDTDEAIGNIKAKSYASPLSYYRAESALINADTTFRAAQKWMFYTLQALNYKWRDRFALSNGAKRYDSTSLFKCRNAAELDDLLTQMVTWDAIRKTQTTDSPLLISRISLMEHVLARNPNRFSPDSRDPGVRQDDTITPRPDTLPIVSTLTYFQNQLARRINPDGVLDIQFSTAFGTQGPDQLDGVFFLGATFGRDGGIILPGYWRERIVHVKVNVIADDAPTIPSIIGGALSYGGTVYFRTRVAASSGDLLAEPFRFWVSPSFDQSFVPIASHRVSIPVAYNRRSAVTQTDSNGLVDNLGATFQVNAFAERSIAATEWHLIIPTRSGATTTFDVRKVRDIEIIIAYRNSNRVVLP